jgi:hypothetical protein
MRLTGCPRHQAIKSSGEAADSKGNLAGIMEDGQVDVLM